MTSKRMLGALSLVIAIGLPLATLGCSKSKDDGMVDAPLMKNAPPPPPAPDKPTLTPSGAGGAPETGATKP